MSDATDDDAKVAGSARSSSDKVVTSANMARRTSLSKEVADLERGEITIDTSYNTRCVHRYKCSLTSDLTTMPTKFQLIISVFAHIPFRDVS